VGLLIDTNVFVEFERQNVPVDLLRWESSDDVFISVVTVSELLMGVHRADNEVRKKRRSDFVEAILAGISVLDFTAAVARCHAKLHAELLHQGQPIGAHDIMIAATAIHHEFALLTDNIDEFSRAPNLKVIPFEASKRPR
jgi:tRNA(fMet)-specific endonuclease VapC